MHAPFLSYIVWNFNLYAGCSKARLITVLARGLSVQIKQEWYHCQKRGFIICKWASSETLSGIHKIHFDSQLNSGLHIIDPKLIYASAKHFPVF